MRALVFISGLAALLLSGCGCSDTGTSGDADTDADVPDVHDPLVFDGPCGPCDDDNHCTMDLCNSETLECVHLPLDLDFDGHVPAECGGDDCDDTRADVYAGATEVCIDGVDQDCDTIVDGPILMMEEVTVSAAGNSALSHDLEWTGSEFAVAWTNFITHDDKDVILSRLDGEGERRGEDVLIRECRAFGLETISLVWNGTSLAYCWYEDSNTIFTRTSPTGEVEVPATTISSGFMPEIAWSGEGYGVAWMDSTGLDFLTLDAGGTLTHGPTTLMDGSVGFGENKPSLAWTGSEFVMVWEAFDEGMSNLDLHFGRIDTAAELVGSPVRLTDTGAWWHPRIAWTGSELGVVFGIPVPAVFFFRVDPLGEVVRRDVQLTDFTMDSDYPEIAWTGSEFGVSWVAGPEEGERAIAFNLLDATGDPRYDALLVTERRTWSQEIALAWTGSEFGIAWQAPRNSDDCLTEPSGPGCVSEVYITRIGLCD